MLASNRGREALRAYSQDQAEGEAPCRRRVTQLRKPIPFGPSVLPPRIARYLATTKVPSPCLVVDLSIVERQYADIAKAFTGARVFYAVKANPDDAILASLTKLGSSFDAASIGEIDMCLKHGVNPLSISYGNTIKKQADIAAAYARGVRLYAFDSIGELEKLAVAAPGAKVFCRVLTPNEGAEWPLSRKFGCEPEMAIDLMARAKQLGLDAYGISFHVGSQQLDPTQFDVAIGTTAEIFRELAKRGIELRMINVGGGFPSRYLRDVPPIEDYARAIDASLGKWFGHDKPEIIVEPGRYIVGDAGVIQAEVVLVADKGGTDKRPWVYLDVGKFHGLAETMDEAIKYRIVTLRDGDEKAPVILAGPTCDSADTLYEKSICRLPTTLKAGDKVWILSTGAYTTTYSSVAFNGMPPLAAVCI
ncbi:MAG: type III PLP-dependent enzyme [Alphaproteobacteria bacterium]|nr:type III PLP-dependent enzyme [Alphaproteobacteria bacterium]